MKSVRNRLLDHHPLSWENPVCGCVDELGPEKDMDSFRYYIPQMNGPNRSKAIDNPQYLDVLSPNL